MSREAFDNFVDLGAKPTKARLHRFIDAADGWHRVTLEPKRLTRSQQQNRTYWGFCVAPLAMKLMEQSERPLRPETAKAMAHFVLACECLGFDEVPHPVTGELIREPWSTAKLDVPAFSEFYERVCCYLAEMGIVVAEPDPCHGLSPIGGRS